jgi:hypothetical protein
VNWKSLPMFLNDLQNYGMMNVRSFNKISEDRLLHIILHHTPFADRQQ